MRGAFIFPTAAVILFLLPATCLAEDAPLAPAGTLKVHGIFASNMVIQRGKPIQVWGWAKPGQTVSVQLGAEKAEARAAEGKGRWEVTFPAREASAEPHTLTVVAGAEKVEMTNVVFGDVWVMNGQSNMAFGLGKIQHGDMEAAQANLPLLRLFSIDANEQSTLSEDIPAEKISTKGWAVSTPETAPEFSAIGYVFGSRLQRALNIPVGVIKNARGGASIESLVPRHKFDDDPVAKRYAESVEKRIAEFNPEAEADVIWQRQLARAKGKGLPEDKWPKKPDPKNLTSWNVPGKSPSDMASVYNGMFGVFKGYNIKGVLFHQGFNNAIGSNCRPKRYRVLMKLMVEGWREDFKDPALPVCVIGGCGGADPQTLENFEVAAEGGAAYIREAQRLGLADVGDPANTAFVPDYDVRIPGLHPGKKREHGERAARWALSRIYKAKIEWNSATLVSAERESDTMVLKFDKGVMPDDGSPIPEGFSIAGEDGKFYLAHARFPLKPGAKSASNAQAFDTTVIRIWSPLVKEPKAVRYGWATCAMGNLKVNGKPWLPLQSFRTDSWDYPESDDPTVSAMTGEESKKRNEAAVARLEERKTKEAEMAKEILERSKTLARPTGKTQEKSTAQPEPAEERGEE